MQMVELAVLQACEYLQLGCNSVREKYGQYSVQDSRLAHDLSHVIACSLKHEEIKRREHSVSKEHKHLQYSLFLWPQTAPVSF